MNYSAKAKAILRHSAAPSQSAPSLGGIAAKGPATNRRSLQRWAVLGLCLVLTAGVTWAVLEFVIWNKLPAELVGKWVVQDGEQDGATFDFFRGGAMVGRINLRGKEGIVNASVRVEAKTLYSTTMNPNTKKEETRQQTIVKLDERSLVLQDERGQLLKMERAD